MVKLFIISLLFLTSSFADLQEEIKSFVPPQIFAKQENLIKILFKNEHSFYNSNNDSIKILKVIKTLKNNGLFKLFYNKPINLKVKFITKKNGLIFIKVISQSLESIGYNYFLTTEVVKNDKEFIWDIAIHTKHLINPILFAKELSMRGCIIKNIKKDSKNSWVYSINSENAKLNATNIEFNIYTKLKKPIEPYLIYTKNSTKVKFKTSFSDHWYPSVIFLDKALHVVSQTKKYERRYVLKLAVPPNSIYMKVGDVYSLDNIKHGLAVYLESKHQER